MGFYDCYGQLLCSDTETEAEESTHPTNRAKTEPTVTISKAPMTVEEGSDISASLLPLL